MKILNLGLYVYTDWPGYYASHFNLFSFCFLNVSEEQKCSVYSLKTSVILFILGSLGGKRHFPTAVKNGPNNVLVKNILIIDCLRGRRNTVESCRGIG